MSSQCILGLVDGFLEPDHGKQDFAQTYRLDQDITISWYARKTNLSAQAGEFSLSLRNHPANYLQGEQSTYYVPIFKNISFSSTGPTSNCWKYPDCANTVLTYNWTFPKALNGPNDHYQFMGWDSIRGENILSRGFLIAQALPSSSTATTTALGTPGPQNSTGSPDVSPTSTTVPMQSQTSMSATAKSSLTTGAKVGIGVGCALVALLAITGVIFFCWSRRRREKDSREIMNQENQKVGVEVREVAGRYPGELEQGEQRFEVDARARSPVELETDERRY